ncbi:8762_t:CDS:2 [Diversispora eburnea]|uniref:8762_t:CDS:1 n=1 Tax=Diversispora eburnea TaxID=1213867 RepID=A0A9N9GS12_9GLOM|nr:8762_t:CDS:2 [Diversispora eburnea]
MVYEQKQRTVMELKINQKIDEIKKGYEIEIVIPSWKKTKRVRCVGIEMIIDPIELKQKIQNIFTHWVTKEKVENPKYYSEWKEIYSNSKSQIKEEWYSTLTQEFAKER